MLVSLWELLAHPPIWPDPVPYMVDSSNHEATLPITRLDGATHSVVANMYDIAVALERRAKGEYVGCSATLPHTIFHLF